MKNEYAKSMSIGNYCLFMRIIIQQSYYDETGFTYYCKHMCAKFYGHYLLINHVYFFLVLVLLLALHVVFHFSDLKS